eukprot:366097-Chlamydomonas_euryale.AAC.9
MGVGQGALATNACRDETHAFSSNVRVSNKSCWGFAYLHSRVGGCDELEQRFWHPGILWAAVKHHFVSEVCQQVPIERAM